LPERAISAIALSMLAHALNPTVFPPRREDGARNRLTDVNGASGAGHIRGAAKRVCAVQRRQRQLRGRCHHCRLPPRHPAGKV